MPTRQYLYSLLIHINVLSALANAECIDNRAWSTVKTAEAFVLFSNQLQQGQGQALPANIIKGEHQGYKGSS